MRLLRTKKI